MIWMCQNVQVTDNNLINQGIRHTITGYHIEINGLSMLDLKTTLEAISSEPTLP